MWLKYEVIWTNIFIVIDSFFDKTIQLDMVFESCLNDA